MRVRCEGQRPPRPSSRARTLQRPKATFDSSHEDTQKRTQKFPLPICQDCGRAVEATVPLGILDELASKSTYRSSALAFLRAASDPMHRDRSDSVD